MSKITFYSNGIDIFREAYKAVTPRVEEPVKIEKEESEYRKVEEVSSSNNNPNKRDEPTPQDFYDRFMAEKSLHPVNITDGEVNKIR